MAKFKSPGFKTRHRQAMDAKFGIKPVPVPTMKNPCNELDLGLFGRAVLADFMKRPPAFGMGRMGRFLRSNSELQALADGAKAGRKAGVLRMRNDFEDYDHPPKPAHWSDTFKTPERFMSKLQKRGFKRLGSGAYSTVWGKPGSDKVIKVCRRAESDGYPMFAAWAHANPSPYLPRIHSFKRHADWYVVVLDRMEQTVSATSREEGLREATGMLWEYTRTGGGNRKAGVLRQAIMNAVFTSLPGIKEMLEALHDEFEGLAHFDMHDENWMLSKDGQLVLIDPLSGANSEKSKTKNDRISRIKAVVRPAA